MADTTDVLMMFVYKTGRSLGGESTAAVADSDHLATEFAPGSFFELHDFSFGGGIEDSHNGGDDDQPRLKNEVRGTLAPGQAPAGKPARKTRRGGARFGQYMRNPDYLGFDAILDEISISRQMDKASMPLLQCCVDQTPLQKAVLIKRKFTYNRKKGEKKAYETYLRLEFKEPLITGVEWEDEDAIREKVKFVCRGIEVQYRSQSPDGDLRPAVEVTFDYKPAR